MPNLLTTDPFALRMLMTDDLYSIAGPELLEIVEIEVQGVEKPAEQIPQSFNYLGDNNKYILVLMDSPDYAFCSSQNMEVLSNILKGRQLEVKDIALLNLAKYPEVTFASLKEYFACSKMVLFGINPSAAGLADIPSNQATTFKEVKILATYSIDEMQADVAKKRIFWNEMKVF